MKNNKGFTLIEMLSVMVILAILLMVAILGVSNYLDRSKRKLYVETAREYIKIAAGMIAKNDLVVRDTNTTYYINVNNLEADNKKVKQSPYGNWVDAYVVVTIKDDKSFVYYWVSVDETGHRIDLVEEGKLSTGKLYITDNKEINNSYPIGGRDNIVIIDKDGVREKTEPAITMDTEVAMECFEWEDNGDGTATITNYNANCSKEVDIPSKIGNLTVTTIGDSAFKSKGITKVISYAGVTKIGYGAFQSNKLNYVKLSKSIKTIGSFAFYSAGVKELIMSEGVEEIGSYAFANNSICSVTLPVSLRKIGDYAFQNNCLTNDGLNSNPTLGAGVYSNNKFHDDSMFV